MTDAIEVRPPSPLAAMRAGVMVGDEFYPLPPESSSLTQAEYEVLRDSIRNWRDRLLCTLLRATGLRISEVLSLTPSQFNQGGLIEDYYIVVRRGKTKDPQLFRFYLPGDVALDLKRFIEGHRLSIYDRVFGNGRDPSKHLSRVHAWRIFKAAGVTALGRPIHPHEFRHLYYTDLVDAGIPPLIASKMIGDTAKVAERHYYDLNADKMAAIQRRVRA